MAAKPNPPDNFALARRRMPNLYRRSPPVPRPRGAYQLRSGGSRPERNVPIDPQNQMQIAQRKYLQENHPMRQNRNNFAMGSSTGEVKHSEVILSNIHGLLNDKATSDAIVIVEGQRFPVHKAILAASSLYFKEKFFGPDIGTGAMELSLESSRLAFAELLKYAYGGHLQLHSLDIKTATDLLELAGNCGFMGLETAVAENLLYIVNDENVYAIYSSAVNISADGLIDVCSQYLKENVSSVFESENFVKLSPLAFTHMFINKNFGSLIQENEIANAIARWVEAHQNEKSAYEPVLAQWNFKIAEINGVTQIVKCFGTISNAAGSSSDANMDGDEVIELPASYDIQEPSTSQRK